MSKTVISLGPADLQAAFIKSGQGKPLVTLEGLPAFNEGITPDRLRDLAEQLYQIARFAELESYPAISLRY